VVGGVVEVVGEVVLEEGSRRRRARE